MGSPSQKTHLATRLAPQAPLRVMPAMKIKSDSWLYVLGLPGFPSQYAKDEERHQADARSIDNTFLLAANVFAFLAALLLSLSPKSDRVDDGKNSGALPR